MIRAGGLLLASILFIGLKSRTFEHPISSFIIADTVRIEIDALYDSMGMLEKYKAHVTTPVCEIDKCYAIEIDFYWDLIGRFLRYDTIRGQGLTKLDHIPFTTRDYLKLRNILSNPNSALASYTKEELVKNTRSSEIDGFTGATIQEIKESVIEGGVYSCYTLWHIANGTVADSIQKATKSMLNKDIVEKMVSQHDQEANYYLIESFSEEDFATYLPQVLQTILDGEGYYAKNAIEAMPKDIIGNNRSQEFFALHFSQLNYFAQVALLEKLNKKALSAELQRTLRENIGDRNSYKNDLVQKLIFNNCDK